MHSNLSAACKSARELISVPEIPLVAIFDGMESHPKRVRRSRRAGLLTALVAGVALVTVAAAGEVWNGARLSFNSGGMTILWNGPLGYKEKPSDDDIRAAVRQATFPIELPAGLPDGATPLKLLYTPGMVNIAYTLPGRRAEDSVIWVTLADPRAADDSTPNKNRPFVRLGSTTRGAPVVRWLIGRESVILAADGDLKRTLSPQQIARIKDAMTARSTQR